MPAYTPIPGPPDAVTALRTPLAEATGWWLLTACCGGWSNACRWLADRHRGATVADVVAEMCCPGCRGEAPVWIVGQDAYMLADSDGPRVLLPTGETWPRAASATGAGWYDPLKWSCETGRAPR